MSGMPKISYAINNINQRFIYSPVKLTQFGTTKMRSYLVKKSEEKLQKVAIMFYK